MRVRDVFIPLLLSALPTLAQAEDKSRPWFDCAAVYVGQGVAQDLMQIPGSLFGSGLDFDATYYAGIQFTKDMTDVEWENHRRVSIGNEFEVNVLQHLGLQSNQELAISYTARTPDLDLHVVTMNFAMGAGFSYAFGKPLYEDGPDFDPARRYNFQVFFPFEFEWSLPEQSNIKLVTRIHHRSGIVGMIAPPHVGSNFIAVGMRYDF